MDCEMIAKTDTFPRLRAAAAGGMTQLRATPEMIAVSWSVWKSQTGSNTPLDDGFVQAIEAALNTGIAQGAIRGPATVADRTYVTDTLSHGTGPDAPWHVSTNVVHGD